MKPWLGAWTDNLQMFAEGVKLMSEKVYKKPSGLYSAVFESFKILDRGLFPLLSPTVNGEVNITECAIVQSIAAADSTGCIFLDLIFYCSHLHSAYCLVHINLSCLWHFIQTSR